MPQRKTVVRESLKLAHHDENDSILEIGVDEAGRGPLFGRLYVASVILPKGYSNPEIRDSKQIKSKRKLKELYETIKKEAVAWSVQYVEHDVIDEINIRQSVFRGMHASIRETMTKVLDTTNPQSQEQSITDAKTFFLLIDGNDFKPYMTYCEETATYGSIPYITVEGGDHTYQSIAAASILAKYERDYYIRALCEQYPELAERYAIDRNMGYGTKSHIEGIEEWGITQWHRKTYARCNTAEWNPI